MVTRAASEIIGYRPTIIIEGLKSGVFRCRRSRETVVEKMQMFRMVSRLAMKMARLRKAVMSVSELAKTQLVGSSGWGPRKQHKLLP